MTRGNDSGRGLKTGNTGREKSRKVKGEGGDEKGEGRPEKDERAEERDGWTGQRKYFMASMEKKM